MSDRIANILDGKALAKKIKLSLKDRIESIQSQVNRPPGLAVLMVGDNPASKVYVRNKEKSCGKLGINSYGRHFPSQTSFEEVKNAILELNQNPEVDGILVQLPLPEHLDSVALLNLIHPDKDVDGLHPLNLGRLVRGEEGLRSCTPAGVMRVLEEYEIECSGKNVVVVGRSILVGKPLALMLLAKNATLTIAHSRTQNLAGVTREADIVVAAAGKPNLISKEMIKVGATVIDVGINRIPNPEEEGKFRLVGDVDFESVAQSAGYITPVPGGIGPMTVAMLLENTVLSYQRRMGI